MAVASLKIKGGDKLAKKLAEIAGKLAGGGTVRVGFLEGATYPAKPKRRKKGKPGTSKPTKAGAQDSGTLNVATVAFWNEFGTNKAPPRPFFRDMIAAKSKAWGDDMAKIAKATNYDAPQTLGLMGERIKDQLTQSIVDFKTPGNSAETIARKGFDKPLIDTGVMQRAVDYQVTSK